MHIERIRSGRGETIMYHSKEQTSFCMRLAASLSSTTPCKCWFSLFSKPGARWRLMKEILIFKMIVSGHLTLGRTLFEFLPLDAQFLMPLLCSMLGPQPLVICSLSTMQ